MTHDAPAGRETPRPGVALRLPGWAWALLLYTGLWAALAPFHRHPTVSVETDLPAYAALALDPPRWDPFVPVGYPRLLAWTDALTGDLLHAAEALSFLGGALVLVAAHAAARRALGPRSALWTTAVLAVNWQFLQNGLLAGTDALWTAAVLAAFLVFLTARERASSDLHGAAGALVGLSCCLRYAGFAVAPLLVACTLLAPRSLPLRRRAASAGTFALGFALGGLPQWIVAVQDAGNPFANGQAANVWFGMHGNGDWPARWSQIPPDVSLSGVVLGDPAAFLANVADNLGRASLHLVTLPFGLTPAGVPRKPELLAVGLAMCATAVVAGPGRDVLRRTSDALRGAARSPAWRIALVCVAGYLAAVSAAFWMTRFLLPAAVALVVGLCALLRRAVWPALRERRPHLATGLAIAFPLMLAAHTADAWRTFLAVAQQPIDEVGVALAASGARRADVVAATVAQHYDQSLPFEVVGLPLDVRDLEDLQLALAHCGAAYFLHEERSGPDGSYRPGLDPLLDRPDLCPFLEPLWMRREPPRVALFRAR